MLVQIFLQISTLFLVDTSTQNDPKIQDKCIAEGCQKLAVADSEWDNEYCSINCCYDHCKYVYIILKY